VVFGYYDTSGSHKSARLLAICGFLGDPRIWDDFDVEWKRILDKSDWPNRPTEFHMYDCVHGYGEFQDWTFAQRLAIYGHMVDVLTRTNVMALGSLCVKGAYEQLSRADKDVLSTAGLLGTVDFAIQLMFQSAISRTKRYTKMEGLLTGGLGLLFDDGETPEVERRYLDLYNHTKSKHEDGAMLTGMGFGDSVKFTPIQAADMLAYGSYHYQLRERWPGESDFKDFPILPPFQRLIENVAADGGVYDVEAMRRLAMTIRINAENRMPMKSNEEFENFDTGMRKVLGVSRKELKRREEEWQKEHPKTGKKRGRKPKLKK
jgi:hypothetical protein